MSYNCLIRNFILGKLGKFPLMESQSAKKHIFSHRLPSVGFPPNIHIAWNFLRSQNQKSFLASLFRLNLSFNTNPNVSHHWTQVSLQKKTERDFEERTQQIEWPQKTNVVCGVPYWNPPGNCGKVKLKKLFLLRKKCDDPGGHWGTLFGHLVRIHCILCFRCYSHPGPSSYALMHVAAWCTYVPESILASTQSPL